MQSICKDWMVSNDDYEVLDKEYGKLAEFQAWQLFRSNTRNSHTDEQVDIAQEMRLALITAGSYFKRQIYIEKCFELCSVYITDEFTKYVLKDLNDLWENKTKHGANRQKFGEPQEKMLFALVRKFVPKQYRPDRKARLEAGEKFERYCKSITWNRCKAMGKKITRERTIRANQVSISEFEFLCGS